MTARFMEPRYISELLKILDFVPYNMTLIFILG